MTRARAALLLAVTFAVALAAAATGARARAGELVQDAGESLLRYARAQHVDATRTLFVNGAALRLASGTTRDSVSTLLDTFEQRCSGVAGGFGAQLEQVLRSHPRLARGRPARLEPVLRGGDERSGYVACIDLGQAHAGSAHLLARLHAFAASFDLAALGGLRFVSARSDGAYTGYVVVWNAGALPLRAMFPAHTDVAGVDIASIARPRGSRRVLSAWQQVAAPLLVAYHSGLDVAELARTYRAQLIGEGAVVGAGAGDAQAARTLVIARGNQRVLAAMTDDAAGGSVITLAPLR